MSKLKKVAAVAVMVGGMALGGGAAAHAGDDPSGVIIGNLQAVHCDQEFDGGAAFAPSQLAATEGSTQNIGNFCTVVGPVED